MAYTRPIRGGTPERTDMGVDWSAPPGTPIYAIARERLVGIIRNWYSGQPFYWFETFDRRGRPTGRYNYVAEQFRSGLRIGQTVNQGQRIGTVASSGTGLEFGWATRSGQTLAQATTGYREGQATPAGLSYRAQVIRGGKRAAAGPQSSLAQLWIQAGGNPHLANLMAAIAMAESGGRVNATNKNTNGTIDRGLWQINSSHTQFNGQRLLNDPLYNARAAVAIQKSQGLTAWSTYSSGAYRQFLGKADRYSGGTKFGGSRPGGNGQTKQSDIPDALGKYVALRDRPRTAPPRTKNPMQWWWASFTDGWDKLNS